MSPEKSMLLHICCAPDACIPIPDLLAEGWNVTGYYYGSNIHPRDEYTRRLEAVNILSAHEGTECVIPSYCPGEWLEVVRGLEHEPEGGRRCTECFRLQLEASAKEALRLGCGYMCTTLTISPHKNVNLINSLGESISALHGLRWESRIWRKNNGFLRSVRRSRDLGLYRQNYCGCIYSFHEPDMELTKSAVTHLMKTE